MTTILLLHPGEMGASIGGELARVGHDVGWVSTGRSNESQIRAQRGKLKEYQSLAAGLTSAQIVLSVCPPEFAHDVALSISNTGYSGIYVDANATSPGTAKTIGRLFGDRFADGSIIGGPVSERGAPRLYFSGESAENVAPLFSETVIPTKVIAGSQVAASSLKMCYAAYTKGSSALILNIRALADRQGVTEALFDEWELSQPDLRVRSERVGPSTSRKGWRFAAEMEEIAKTFQEVGLPYEFHLGAANVYRRMSPFKSKPPASTQQVIDVLNSPDDASNE